VLDYSVLTHTKGKKADFSDTIIIMTSNLGENEQNGIGFGNQTIHKQKALIDFLPPEFRKRLDKILEFKKLTQDMIIHITDKFLKDLSKQFATKNIELVITAEAKNTLNEIGFDPNMDARSVLRAINSVFKKEIAKIVLSSKRLLGTIIIDHDDEQFTFTSNHPTAENR